MFSWIKRKFAPVFYVQIWETKLKVTDVGSKDVNEDKPLMAIQTLNSGEKKIVAIGQEASSLDLTETRTVNPFSHPRVLFSDFYVGEKLLQNAFSKFAKHKFLRVTPKVVIHPMEKTEGGLTMIEVRAFRELALGAGAVESKVYTGTPLSIAQFDFDSVQDVDGLNDIETSPNSRDALGIGTFLFLILLVLSALYFNS